MRLLDGAPLYAAKDLIAFLGCTHSTALDVLALSGEIAAGKGTVDKYLDLLKAKGEKHEAAHLEKLRTTGLKVVEIDRDAPDVQRIADTIAAMRSGADVIYQGTLYQPPWHGYSDFLLRVDTPSDLGAWSYEVADTKLARTARPKHVMQLCLYSQLVADVQGVVPREAHVVLGDGKTFTFRVADYVHYADAACDRFLAFVAGEKRETVAEPCGHCEFCRWEQQCKEAWESAEHLSLVARLNRAQRAKLASAGITDLPGLALLADGTTVARIQPETLERIRSQARLQHIKRTTGRNDWRRLPLESRKGFARLPEPNDGDLFFDMEGDPLWSADGGLEYLFGFHHLDNGAERFTSFWAHDRASEKKAFEDALDFMTARLARYPDAYIYHYASYEEQALRKLALRHGTSKTQQVDAIKRLAQQYGTRENQVDDLLRDRKLVDLYKVVREAIQTSEPRYSLKNLEVFFAPERTQEIKEGGDSIVAFETWLIDRDPAIRKQIEEYNEFDCRSTRLCRDWLLTLRPGEVEWFDPAKEASAKETERQKEWEEKRREADLVIAQLRDALMRGAGDDKHEQEWRELLGHLLEYHRREARREWWDFFRRLEEPMEKLIDEVECIGGLFVDPAIPERPEKQSRLITLRYPEQETKMGEGKVVRADTGEKLEILRLDDSERLVELKVGKSREPIDRVIALIPEGPWGDKGQRDAIMRYAESIVADKPDTYGALTSILRKDKPRLRGKQILKSDDLLAGTIDAIARMKDTHLVVQGPPGSGKTFTSAHAIVDLLRNKKRVGVTALSHKAINNLLAQIEKVAVEQGFTFRGVKKCSKDEESELNGSIIEDKGTNEEVFEGDYQLIGGTSWLFSDPELDLVLDYLFVDEAGQMSLANVVATGVSARNIVLVGDQMQLSQPIKGVHPGGSGVSALDHLMGTWATVPEDRGILLAQTWRMHPELCRFVSDAFYDGRLEAVEKMSRQKLVLTSDAGGALAPFGLRFVGVEHDEWSQRCEPEAKRLSEVYRELLHQSWVNAEGETLPITMDDILVVSPYNMQVKELKECLPDGVRVGTVDKFQGQEAAVVLISMASSSAENIPRGVEFLFSRNRLNVAISRARCLAVIFASPELLAVPCSKVEHMRLVNTLCWAHAVSEMAGA